MTPAQVKEFYGSNYNFRKQTKMSASTLINWVKWGYVPDSAQWKLEGITRGALKHEDRIK